MAGGAVLIARVVHVVRCGLEEDTRVEDPKIRLAVVAFQARGEYGGPPKHLRVHRPVGGVAAFAAIDTDRGVFVDEGTPLIDMALQAGLLIGLRLVDHVRTLAGSPGWGGGSVGIVAIGALDGAFVDAMLEGHGELRAHGGVAGIAEIGLLFGEHLCGSLRLVNGMAIGSDHVVQGVRAAADVGSRNGLRVAAQARIENFCRADLREDANGFFAAAGVEVVASRAVATLATGVFGLFLAGDNALIVRVAVEGFQEFLVAGATHLAADVVVGDRCARGAKHEQYYAKDPAHDLSITESAGVAGPLQSPRS